MLCKDLFSPFRFLITEWIYAVCITIEFFVHYIQIYVIFLACGWEKQILKCAGIWLESDCPAVVFPTGEIYVTTHIVILGKIFRNLAKIKRLKIIWCEKSKLNFFLFWNLYKNLRHPFQEDQWCVRLGRHLYWWVGGAGLLTKSLPQKCRTWKNVLSN